MLLATVAMHFSPWPQLVGYASLGALAALFGRFATVERRMRIVVNCALLLALAVLVPSLASWAGALPWMMALVLALVAGASTVAVSWWSLGGPGAVIIVFAAGAAYHPVGSGAEVLARVLATLAGGVVAVLTCLVTDRWRAAELKTLRLPPAHVPPGRTSGLPQRASPPALHWPPGLPSCSAGTTLHGRRLARCR